MLNYNLLQRVKINYSKTVALLQKDLANIGTQLPHEITSGHKKIGIFKTPSVIEQMWRNLFKFKQNGTCYFIMLKISRNGQAGRTQYKLSF